MLQVTTASTSPSPRATTSVRGASTGHAPNPRALVFMTGRDCEMYVAAAISSLARQTYEEVRVLFVDDASDDDTGVIARELLAELFPGRHSFVRNEVRWGKARSAHVHLRMHLDEADFVAILDADDELIRTDALASMAERYAAADDVVWTDFVTDTGKRGANGPLDPTRSPRTQGWRTSHFFSFRAALFANVREDHFKDDHGEWLQSACDLAMAYPILDQTRRYRHLPILAHRYRATNPYSHHNSEAGSIGLNSPTQRRNAAIVLAKKPLDCVRWPIGGTVLPTAEAAAVGTSTVAVPRGTADAPRRSGAWIDVAAQTLARECPGLLDLMLDEQDEAPLEVAIAWRWWRWLQTGPARPRVIEIGGGTVGAVIHSMVSALGGTAVSVTASEQAARTLYVRLLSAGVTPQVFHVPLVSASFGGVDGAFPDLGTLAAELTGFDAAIVSADPGGVEARSAVLALPMLVGRLAQQAFRVCLWAPGDPGLRRAVEASWSSVAPDFIYSDGALGGSALCVHASE